MSRSEEPTACYQAKAQDVFLCIYRPSSTVDGCVSNVASALYDSKYTRVPLAHARPFITCHVNNSVICILLSRSNDEWTWLYVRGIGTISGHRSNPWQKHVVKSSEPNADDGKESKLPLSQNHLSCSAANRMHVYIVDILLGCMYRCAVRSRFSCALCSQTCSSLGEEGSFASIGRRFITKMFQV